MFIEVRALNRSRLLLTFRVVNYRPSPSATLYFIAVWSRISTLLLLAFKCFIVSNDFVRCSLSIREDLCIAKKVNNLGLFTFVNCMSAMRW